MTNHDEVNKHLDGLINDAAALTAEAIRLEKDMDALKESIRFNDSQLVRYREKLVKLMKDLKDLRGG